MAMKLLEADWIKKLMPYAWVAVLLGFINFYTAKAKAAGTDMATLVETDIKNTIADPIAKVKAKSTEIIIAIILFVVGSAIMKSKLPPLVKLGGLVAVFYYGGQYVGKVVDPPTGSSNNSGIITITRGSDIQMATNDIGNSNPFAL